MPVIYKKRRGKPVLGCHARHAAPRSERLYFVSRRLIWKIRTPSFTGTISTRSPFASILSICFSCFSVIIITLTQRKVYILQLLIALQFAIKPCSCYTLKLAPIVLNCILYKPVRGHSTCSIVYPLRILYVSTDVHILFPRHSHRGGTGI